MPRILLNPAQGKLPPTGIKKPCDVNRKVFKFLEPRTSNLEPRTSNLEPRTSNLISLQILKYFNYPLYARDITGNINGLVCFSVRY